MKRFWTQSEVDYLVAHYSNEQTSDVAKALGCSVSRVYNKAHSLGLKKSAYFYEHKSSGREHILKVGAATRFKKGQTAWNKGIKFDPGGRSAQTRFKKGDRPHNYRPIGSYRVTKDGILQQKVTDDPSLYPAKRWQPVAKLLWIKHHGAIPKGSFVRFKPDMRTTDPKQVTLDKIELVTPSQNMKRNTIYRYPDEVVKTIKAIGHLNRKINHIERANHEHE